MRQKNEENFCFTPSYYFISLFQLLFIAHLCGHTTNLIQYETGMFHVLIFSLFPRSDRNFIIMLRMKLLCCQFHQHFMYNFYARRSQKRKKILLSHQYLFTFTGSASVKAVRRMLMKLSQRNFSLLTVWLCIFWRKSEYWGKSFF